MSFTLATIFRAFEVHADRVPDAEPSVTLRPKGAVNLTLRARR
jgi:hypothetical protein